MPETDATQDWRDGVTAEFASFVARTTYEDLPDEVVSAIKAVILDTLAVSVAGMGERSAQLVGELVAEAKPAPVATLIGLPIKADPASAAWFNATLGHAIDYDDYCFAMSGHPSVILLPPILALAEERGATGRDLIRSYAAGFEAAIMLSRTVNPDHYGHGWHGTGTVGAVGAACAAAGFLGLDEVQVEHAISIGASMAAGLRQNFGTDVKPFHAGNAARAGVIAAQLASRGFAGDREVLEGHWGFFNTFTDGKKPRPRPEGGFGDPWATLKPGITTKLFPSCGSSHPGIGGILELRRQGLRAEDVATIDINVTDVQYGNLQYPVPKTGLEAKFSMSYCVARALQKGALTIDDFSDAAATDPELRPLVERITMHHDQALTDAYTWGNHRPAVFTVRKRDGSTVQHRTDAPPGAPGHMSRETLHTKVVDCLGRGTIRGATDEVIEIVENLEKLDDVGKLMALFEGV